MSKELAVQGCTWKFQNPSHSGNVSVTGSASTKVKCSSNGVYKDNLGVSISNGTDGSTTSNATGSGTITATSTKNKVENVAPLRKGDSNTVPIVMTGTNMSPPPPTMTYTTTVEIDDPGQSKVKGE